MKRLFFFFCLVYVPFLFSPYAAAFPIGYESYTNWQDLPQLRLGVKSALASSYDRTGGNSDWSHYEWPQGLIEIETTCTVKTIQGPGIIYRFWMPHYMGRNHYVVRMYFDGEETASIDTESNTIFGGLFSYFDEPFITTCAGGQMCYEPVPFADSLVIETINKPAGPFANRHYYQYSYLTYPQTVDVNSYTGTLTSQEQQVRNSAANIFDNAGINPNTNQTGLVDVNTPATGVDTNLVLANLVGPGVINKISLRMDDANDTELLGLNLQVFYDSCSTAAIDIPVGYFFGAGQSRAPYKSLPLGTDSNDGFYCYWPMPFRQSVLVRLNNTTGTAIQINGAEIEYKLQELNHHTCYLHAIESTTVRSSQIYHNILSTTGTGHYVGDLLYVIQDYNSFYMLEGDDVIYSDGELVQYGTGLEDTYNGGAYYNWVAVIASEPEGPCPQSATRPLSGILYVNKAATSRADQYRWRIADCIPFSESVEVNVECRYSGNGACWKSVGFWYELPHFLEDLNKDGKVNFTDFAKFAAHWRGNNCQTCEFADFTGDGKVDQLDLIRLSEKWLRTHTQ